MNATRRRFLAALAGIPFIEPSEPDILIERNLHWNAAVNAYTQLLDSMKHVYRALKAIELDPMVISLDAARSSKEALAHAKALAKALEKLCDAITL